VHRAFHLRPRRAQVLVSKAQMKGPTRAACDGLEVKPPPLDSRQRKVAQHCPRARVEHK